MRVAAGVIAALLVVGLAAWMLRPPADTPVAARPTPTATPTPTTAPSGPCGTQASGPITPKRITFPGIVRNAEVLALPRDGRNVPSVPPTSVAGKRQVAWDRPPGIKPGSQEGNALLNAHTWPDGSALGNKFLKRLKKGDPIIVRNGDDTVCFEVDRRVEVLASDGYPPYFDKDGPHQLALVVCSGQRLGPGNWTHRTIWFAKRVQT